jgi:signal transduction histidine kinase
MNKQSLSQVTKKFLIQILLQSIVIVVTALCSFMFMTFLIADVFCVQDIYLAASYEMLGTLIILVIVLVPLNTVFYQRRRQETITISEAILKVANGDFSTRIPIRKKDQMNPVYEDFNKMCAELESVQILRNDFINSYTHEFKTPISSINGFASLLIEQNLTKEEQQQYLKIIVEESSRLSQLASNTMLFSKISSQQILTNMETYDLGEQVRQCSIILSKDWMAKGLQFSGDFQTATFVGNKELMQHLWLNLLTNAIKYTPKGGEINVEVLLQDGNILVKISDTGEGMTPETMEHIFDPYYQGDKSHSQSGLGLGLPIAKRIVELSNGEILVKSQLSVGSEFTVRLPQK